MKTTTSSGAIPHRVSLTKPGRDHPRWNRGPGSYVRQCYCSSRMGRNTIALAAWLAPMCLLRFVRIQSPLRGLAIAYAVLVALRGNQLSRNDSDSRDLLLGLSAHFSGSRHCFPLSCRTGMLAPRLREIPAHTGFPRRLGRHAIYIQHKDRSGVGGRFAYTQSGDLPLLQLLSVTGLWGITFLIGWFAAVANQCLAGRTSDAALLGEGSRSFGGVYLAVMLLGGLRFGGIPTDIANCASPHPYRRKKRPALPCSDGLVPDVVAGSSDPNAQIGQFRAATEADAG